MIAPSSFHAWTVAATPRPWPAPVWTEPRDDENLPDLPRQPVRPDARQRRLARAYLQDLEGLYDLLLTLRLRADEQLASRYPVFAGKPYPLGRCLPIRDAVFDALIGKIREPDCDVSRALHEFIAQGGLGNKIWGVLRDSYFQNAIQLGPFYVDVANDTVTVTKPKIEILPIAQSGMVAVADLSHFASVARRYWEAEVYRNTVFPALAAYFPMICVSRSGAAWIEPGSGQVTTMIRRQGLRPSLRFLTMADAPPPERVTGLLRIKAESTAPLIVSEGDPIELVEAARREHRQRDATYLAACRAARADILRRLQNLDGQHGR